MKVSSSSSLRPAPSAFLLPWIRWAGKHCTSFQLLGYSAFLLSFSQSSILLHRLVLSQLTPLVIAGALVLMFYILVLVMNILTDGKVINFHHEIVIVVRSASLAGGLASDCYE